MGPAGCIFLLPLLLGISGTNEEEPENRLKSSQMKKSTSCWVTGCGYSGTYQYMKPSHTLKELKVPLTDLQTCSDYYQKANLCGVKSIISEDMICSKLPVEMDQCIGSRGDPLTCRVEDSWVLAGVVSWGSNCLQTNEPGIYTNASFYKSWIEKSAISQTDFSAVLSWTSLGSSL